MAQLGRRQRIPRGARPDGWRAFWCGAFRAGPGPGAIAEKGRARLSETLEPALPDHLDEQAERLMHRLCDAGLSVATAESCTGGKLAALLTDNQGAGPGVGPGIVLYTKDGNTARRANPPAGLV